MHMQTTEELINIIRSQQSKIQLLELKIQSQKAKILELTQSNQELKKEIIILREKVNTNSNNSSTSPFEIII